MAIKIFRMLVYLTIYYFCFILIKTFIHPTLTVKIFFKLKNAALGIFLINDKEILEAK